MIEAHKRAILEDGSANHTFEIAGCLDVLAAGYLESLAAGIPSAAVDSRKHTAFREAEHSGLHIAPQGTAHPCLHVAVSVWGEGHSGLDIVAQEAAQTGPAGRTVAPDSAVVAAVAVP